MTKSRSHQDAQGARRGQTGAGSKSGAGASSGPQKPKKRRPVTKIDVARLSFLEQELGALAGRLRIVEEGRFVTTIEYMKGLASIDEHFKKVDDNIEYLRIKTTTLGDTALGRIAQLETRVAAQQIRYERGVSSSLDQQEAFAALIAAAERATNNGLSGSGLSLAAITYAKSRGWKPPGEKIYCSSTHPTQASWSCSLDNGHPGNHRHENGSTWRNGSITSGGDR